MTTVVPAKVILAAGAAPHTPTATVEETVAEAAEAEVVGEDFIFTTVASESDVGFDTGVDTGPSRRHR